MLRRGNKSKMWQATQSFHLPVLVASLLLIFVVSIMLFLNHNETPSSSFELLGENEGSSESPGKFHPTVEFRNGTDLIWQIPDSPKAVLFFAHGCNGRAVHFWDRSPSCPNCMGFPEERSIVLHALDRNFAVITISSARRCWSFGEERSIVTNMIKWWVETHNLDKLPLVALGASSGGYFVSVLPIDMKFNSVALMISEGMFEEMDIPDNYPPTLFVHMPKDVYRQQKVSENMETLRSRGVDVAEIECIDIPLTRNTLADRILGLDQTVSAQLFELFHDKGFIDEHGYMRNDGRATRWKEALRNEKNIKLEERLVPHVQEELNLAFAYHEMTSPQSEEIFKWFESHMS